VWQLGLPTSNAGDCLGARNWEGDRPEWPPESLPADLLHRWDVGPRWLTSSLRQTAEVRVWVDDPELYRTHSEHTVAAVILAWADFEGLLISWWKSTAKFSPRRMVCRRRVSEASPQVETTNLAKATWAPMLANLGIATPEVSGFGKGAMVCWLGSSA